MIHDTDLFAGLRRPDAPPGLGGRALAAAYEAATEPRRPLTDLLWEHRGLWLIWVSLVVLLLPVNLATLMPKTCQPASQAISFEFKQIGDDPDLQQLINRHPTRKNLTHTAVLQLLENMLNEGPADSTKTTPQGDPT